MTDAETILIAAFGLLSFAFAQRHLALRDWKTQVRLLQIQRRMERECREKGIAFCPDVEGLWPDLDEKQRLRDRIRELEKTE